ncbi:MAG: methyltransferase domain-containing protein [Burkholderiales bacterium]
MAQDSSRPDFWDTRYRSGVTPWDAGGAPPLLVAWVESRPAGGRVLVPGCGAGYEVELFAARGWDVLAIDFSDAAVEAARRGLGALSRLVRKADFFALAEGAFDLVYERALLCALPRREWPRWAQRMAELVRPGGLLAGFYYVDDNLSGPPFGVSLEQLAALRAPAFALVEDKSVPPAQSLPVFQGKERWQLWERRL